MSTVIKIKVNNKMLLFNSLRTDAREEIRYPIFVTLVAAVWMRAGKRTFKPQRLKSQICLIGGNGFVCSSLNELNSKITYFGCSHFL